MSFITAEGVSFSWGQARILQEVSLCAGKGKFVGVIGPNGSGKSTLLKCIYRVLHQDAGCIFLDGKENTKMGYKETARFLGVVAQHNIYDFDFSVRDIVLMGRSPHKKTMEQDNAEDRRIAREALARVGLSGFEERTFAELSGGEQQRVILARALAQQTRALILDEPTNHLDVKYQLQLLNTVKSLDLTVVAAFHDLNLAGLYCDEIRFEGWTGAGRRRSMGGAYSAADRGGLRRTCGYPSWKRRQPPYNLLRRLTVCRARLLEKPENGLPVLWAFCRGAAKKGAHRKESKNKTSNIEADINFCRWKI